MKTLFMMSIGLCFVAANWNIGQSSCNFPPNFNPNLRIINGTVAPEGSHPWAAALMIRIFDNNEHICGGSIITPRHVLTAAHCLEEGLPGSIWIVVGQNRIDSVEDQNLIRSQQFVIHENYNKEKMNFDIGLVITSRKIEYRKRVISPICLPKTNLDLEKRDAKVTAVGWGLTSIDDISSSDVLRQVELAVLPLEVCTRLYPYDFKNKLCMHMEWKNVYSGDSGSPITWKNPKTCKEILVGLVSLGSVNGPSLATDVSAYLDWIKNKTRGKGGEAICTAP